MTDDAAHNQSLPPGDGSTTDRHLSADDLNAYLDGDLAVADRARVDAHVASCAACRRDLADLRATLTLLHGMPELRPRRSFQLGPEQVQVRSSRGPWLLRLMPSLPALRTATAVVAMLLIAVIAGDLVTNQNDEPDRAALEAPTDHGAARGGAPAAGAPTSTVTSAATNRQSEAAVAQPNPTSPPPGAEDAAPPTPTRERMAAFAETEADSETADEAPPAAPAAEIGADEDIAEEQGDSSAAGDQAADTGSAAGGAAAAQSVPSTAAATPSPTATPPPTATATPSPSPTATPTATVSPTPAPSPTPVAQPSSDGDSRPSLWRVAEIGLGLLLLWLLVSLIGARRVRRP